MGKITAYCYASGQIEFGEPVPEGALPIIEGEEQFVRKLMDATARHAYDGVTLLVPGVPEAPDQMAGVDALIRFRNWLQDREAARRRRRAASSTGLIASKPSEAAP